MQIRLSRVPLVNMLCLGLLLTSTVTGNTRTHPVDMPQASALEFYVVPYAYQPPNVDGRLDDWARLPNSISLSGKEHVTWGSDRWTGDSDLSADIHLAWREEGLYLGADVNDDALAQPFSGNDIWKGDHLNLWIDFTPGVDPERTAFGTGQFHVVVSPGNLISAGSHEVAVSPEVYFYIPEGMPCPGSRVAAVRTPKGWEIEAFIPSSILNMQNIHENQDANFEIALSDSDTSPTVQETLITRGTVPWKYSRKNMLPMVFGNVSGKANIPKRNTSLAKEIKLGSGTSQHLVFTADPVVEGKLPYIFFRARLQHPEAAGYIPRALALKLNGKPVEGKRISNRPAQSTMKRGDQDILVCSDGALAVWQCPSFSAVDEHPEYGLVDGVKACEFEFRLDGLLQPGENTLCFDNLAQANSEYTYEMVLGDIGLQIKSPPPIPEALGSAPTGVLPIFEPKAEFPRMYTNLSQDGMAKIGFEVNGEKFQVESRFSAPDGMYHEGSTTFYTHQRSVIEHDEWIEVRDTFKNLSGENLPIMQVHTCRLGKAVQRVWLCCLEIPSGNSTRMESDNPSAFGVTERTGVGLLPLNDEFQVHATQSAADGAIEISDRSFVLKPGAEYTAEWAIIPVSEPDMWAFVNAARRMLGVNFPLEYCFAFMTGQEPVQFWSDSMFRNYVENKSANLLVQSNDYPLYNKSKAYGLAWQAVPHDNYINFQKRVQKLFPDGHIKTAIYYHSFLDTLPGDEDRFKVDRRLDSMGIHMNYGGPSTNWLLYVPTLENAFGRETAKCVDIILDKVGADGVYWDEFETSRGTYAYGMWDGCSADIDQNTFRIVKLKASVALITMPFRLYHAERIMAHGPLVTNGAPHTRTGRKLHFLAFTETGSSTYCRKMLLYTPVALGDAITERTGLDAYQGMLKSLEQGCLYAWYSTKLIPTYPSLTQYMYPTTPIELHSGYIFAKERILTTKSGLLGWGDSSDFTPHVFNREGKETNDVVVSKVLRDNRTYAEVRIPEGYSVVLVRGKQDP